jgi:hypothetical protein
MRTHAVTREQHDCAVLGTSVHKLPHSPIDGAIDTQDRVAGREPVREMLMIALVADAMALAIAERHQVEIAGCHQFEGEFRAPCDAREHRLGKAGEPFRTVIDRVAMRDWVEPKPVRKLIRKLRRSGCKSLDGLEMGHPVDDMDAIDVRIELAMRDVDDRAPIARARKPGPE